MFLWGAWVGGPMTGIDLPKWTVQTEAELAEDLATRNPVFVGDGARPVWSIDTPPPYPSGKWHIGAVAGYSLIDMIARCKRMAGYDVLFPWGTDRNGINIEFTVEKKEHKLMREWDRAEFNEACRKEISQYSDQMIATSKRIGLSCDFEKGYETDSPEYRAFSQAIFLELFEQGLIVEELRPNTFDPKLGTTIADAEVYYEERKTRLNHVQWTIKETGETVSISTTRPELIFACRAVAVHPDNEETKHLIGKTAILPVQRHADLGQEVPIVAHSHVKTDFGSGVMMICSYGDQADVQLFRELNLDPIAAIGLDGRLTDVADKYAGMKPEPARKQLITDLEEAGLLPEFDTIQQKFPTSERSKAAVEIVLLKEWYVKQTHAVEDLRKIANEVEFHPAKHRQLLLDWIDTVSIEWPISRRRYYHTEIPIWLFVDAEGEEAPYVAVPPSNRRDPTYYRPWAEGTPAGTRVLHRETREELGSLEDFQAAHPELTLQGEVKVFDTWMDSSVSNQYILKDYQDQEWAKDHVCSVRTQGRDIVRTWLYYSLLKSYLKDGKKGFEHAWIHGMGMDKSGRKMSKSTGNVIAPEEIIDKFGSEAFRLWIAGECGIGDDFRINPQKVQGASKFLQKLSNVAGFIARFEKQSRPEALALEDQWILGELAQLEDACKKHYEDLDCFQPANLVRSFVWNLFAPHYLEIVKVRAYADDPAAIWTLYEVLRRVLYLLAPITPIFADALARPIFGVDVHNSTFEDTFEAQPLEGMTEAIEAFNSMVWKTKQDQQISLGSPISGIEIPEVLAPMAASLTAMHKLE